MRVGYVRVSFVEQNEERQILELKKADFLCRQNFLPIG